MKQNQLDRAIKLVRRTGDRLLVMDRDSDEVLAIMSLDEYERLLGGMQKVEDMSEIDFLDKINREIALWRENHRDDARLDLSEADLEEGPGEEMNRSGEQNSAKEEQKNLIATPSETKEAESQNSAYSEPKLELVNMAGAVQEDDLSDVPAEDEEDKFYIEPIE